MVRIYLLGLLLLINCNSINLKPVTSQEILKEVRSYKGDKAVFTIKVDEGYEGINKVDLAIESKFIRNYKSQNVVGYLEGNVPDSCVVVVAHYDHLGMMGDSTVFCGANDNASGVALLLSLAKHYAVHKPKYSILFIAFGGEEIGLIGSKYFVDNPLVPLSSIKF